MDSLGDILSKQHKNSPLMKSIQAGLVVEFADALFKEQWGAAIAVEAKAVSLKNQVLTVACMNAALASEVRLKQNWLRQQINKEFGKETVTSFKIML